MTRASHQLVTILAPLVLAFAAACSGAEDAPPEVASGIEDADLVVLAEAAEAGADEAAVQGDSGLEPEWRLEAAAPPQATDKLKIMCAIVSGSRTFARCMGLGSYSASQCGEVAIDLARSVCAD